MNETRIIDTKVPDSYFDKILGAKKYPVIYVLDGEDMFEFTSAIITFLSTKKGNRILPECIVVGIRNKDRNKDLTHIYSFLAHLPHAQKPFYASKNGKNSTS